MPLAPVPCMRPATGLPSAREGKALANRVGHFFAAALLEAVGFGSVSIWAASPRLIWKPTQCPRAIGGEALTQDEEGAWSLHRARADLAAALATSCPGCTELQPKIFLRVLPSCLSDRWPQRWSYSLPKGRPRLGADGAFWECALPCR